MMKDMKLSDLKNDMVVELRDGRKALVVFNGKVMLLGANSYLLTRYYYDNMIYNTEENMLGKEYDIMKVWKITSEYGYTYLSSLCNTDFIKRHVSMNQAELLFDRDKNELLKEKLTDKLKTLEKEIASVREQLAEL